ncbi:LamG-like jellyroll fold domain-containing protein [Saliphagus infecundisoli]|uniref:LamG-like jellyroll fold domain-containing protein n=1 Tax=Saliphagus infecundisoli TaxID=1849069 RepID=A0ABD5Q9E2_9EURY|nr:LamG-like jellyroll fold domain-containing protein [Saliphagus infecundisoli]
MATDDGSVDKSGLSVDRRTFLTSVGIIGATSTAITGAQASEGKSKTTTKSTQLDASEWEPVDVPFDMATPWYNEVSPATVHDEYPRPQLVREEWRNLNGVWEFSSASEGESAPTGQELNENILVPFPPESSLSGVQRHEDRMWYRTTFSIPHDWLVPTAHPGQGIENNPNSQRLLLHFERVDWEATVYVNGEEVTIHRGGYDSFAIDVTDYLTDEGKQELVVGVYDPTDTGTQPVGKQEVEQDRDIFFTPSSGIWDTVWLEPVPDASIEGLDLTPNIEEEQLELTVDAPERATVKATAFDGDEKVSSITGRANEELSLPVPDPHLWSPDDPFLYDLEVELYDSASRQKEDNSRGNANGRNNVRDDEKVNRGASSPSGRGQAVDVVESYFGMRSIGKQSIRGVVRPTLNGKFVFHNGIYDQGYWPDGLYTPPTDNARKYDLELAKDLGFNAYRKHIKIPSKRWYYWADKLGLLVWQDVPNQPLGQPARNEDAQESFRSELRDMIAQNDNHPSLAVWIPVNEGWGHGKTNYDRIRSTTDFVRNLDSERLINSLSGIDTMFVDGEVKGDMLDNHNYGQVTPLPEPTDTQMSVVGESSAGWTPIDGHQWDDGSPSGNTPAVLVDNLITRAENNWQYMMEDGFSGAINLQTTDTEYHYQGVVTYDREVFKPDLVSDDAVSRIREANQALIDASKQIDQRPYPSVDAPASISADEGFELFGMLTNPEREEAGSFAARNVEFSVGVLPSGFSSEAKTATTFDAIPEGSSETVHWMITVDEDSVDPDIYEFAVEVSFEYENEVFTVTETVEIEVVAGEPRLVGSWPFDNGSGDTATDVAGGNDGTLVGDPQWMSGKAGSALAFDGNGDYVDANTNVLDTTWDYSVAAWVKLDDASGFQTAVSQVMGDGTAFFLQYLGAEGKFSFSFFGGRAFGGPTVEAGQWYHLAAVHDTYEGRAKLYVDGERVAAIDREPTASSGNLLVGRATVDGNAVDFWNGTIDEVRVYQSSLDDATVRDLYESSQ